MGEISLPLVLFSRGYTPRISKVDEFESLAALWIGKDLYPKDRIRVASDKSLIVFLLLKLIWINLRVVFILILRNEHLSIINLGVYFFVGRSILFLIISIVIILIFFLFFLDGYFKLLFFNFRHFHLL